jgi:hypothetical protein
MKQPELIYEHPHPISQDGATYNVSVFGMERKDGTWSGWLEFRNAKTGETMKTGQETSQPNRDALAYWATGVEDVYLQGAWRRVERREASTDVRPNSERAR